MTRNREFLWMATDTLVYRINDFEKLLEASAPEATPAPRTPGPSSLGRLLLHFGAAGYMIDTALRSREATRMSPFEIVSELRAANSDLLKQIDVWRRRNASDANSAEDDSRTETEGTIASSMRVWRECINRFLQNEDVRSWADENGLATAAIRTLASTNE